MGLVHLFHQQDPIMKRQENSSLDKIQKGINIHNTVEGKIKFILTAGPGGP